METIEIDLQIEEPILLELGTADEIIVNPTPAPATLKGDKGDTGEQGIQGLKGEKGDTGEQGIQGLKGDKGDTGEQGIQGEKGDKGDKGDTGEQGIQGDKGDKGVILLDSHIGGSVTNNLLYARLRDVRIPANSLANGDVIQVNILALHNNTSLSKRTRLHLTESLATSLSLTNQIAFAVQTTTSAKQQTLNREFIYWNGFLQLIQPSETGAATDPLANSTNTTEQMVPFNPSIDNWFNVSMEGVGQNIYTKTLTRCLIKIIKAS